jgi:hypothetical protein
MHVHTHTVHMHGQIKPKLILRVLGDFNVAILHWPWSHQTPNNKHYIRFTYCHDVFPTTASREKKLNKYDPLIQILRTNGGK